MSGLGQSELDSSDVLTFELPSKDAWSSTALLRWAEDWSPGTLLSQGEPLQFLVPRTIWEGLGEPPPRDADPELVDAWRSQHDAAATLVRTRGIRIHLQSTGHIGGPGLKFHPSFVNDGESNKPNALAPTAQFIERRVAAFNALGSTTLHQQLAFFGEIRRYLEEVEALLATSAAPLHFSFDDHLADFDITHVDRASLAWKQKDVQGRTFDLTLDAIAPDGTRAPLPVGDLDADAPVIARGGKSFILLDEDIAQVARVAQKHRNKLRRHVEPMLRDPLKVLPPGVSGEKFDPTAYSPRVLGFEPAIRVDRLSDVKSSGVRWADGTAGPGPFMTLEIATPDGEVVAIDIATPESARQLRDAARLSVASGLSTPLSIGDHRLEPTDALVQRLTEDLDLYERASRRPSDATPGTDGWPPDTSSPAAPSAHMVAVIVEQEEERHSSRPPMGAIDESSVPWDALDSVLKPGVRLKEHQRQGVAWLWFHYRRERPGVLLADDMGLGKTLQVAAFLALQRATGSDLDRRRPALIITPVILLENWVQEIEAFFLPGTLAPRIVLHGPTAKQNLKGAERGYADLDLVLTNYETLQRHQHTLLKVDWRASVLDEAQWIKNSTSFRARAARGLKRTIGVCATGTPVENSLGDLWSLYDFLSPGRPFGARSAFDAEYVRTDGGVAKVRAALAFPSPASSVLRRTKTEVLSLPPKEEHRRSVEMTPDQVAKERIIAGNPKRPILEVLQDLQKLYQHPRLLHGAPTAVVGAAAAQSLVAESPKLGLTLELLRMIQQRGEKALVFTIWTEMQVLLREVLRTTFDLDRVHIVNGESNQQRLSRAHIRDFAEKPGFNVIILSPLAAGTGLTINQANHVIHYGRWWNPAKEDQATDRAYRIGQTRPVHVYLPLLHHPGSPTTGFDMKLDELVRNKRKVARDFLAPSADAGVTQAEWTRMAATAVERGGSEAR